MLCIFGTIVRMFRLVCVTAHPDDESGGFGGSLLRYRERGAETCVICLTPGQAATHRGGARTDAELAEMRKQEFAAACKILRVSRPVILDYPDGQLYRQELNRVVYELTLQVRQFRPHVMLTFGPEGGITGHPDHSMAGTFAALAFHWAGRANRYADQLGSGLEPHQTHKLYYGTTDFAIPGRQPVTLSPPTVTIDISDHLQAKIDAFKAHKTQSPLWSRMEEVARRRGGREMFHLAASMHPVANQHETDLFEGVPEEP